MAKQKMNKENGVDKGKRRLLKYFAGVAVIAGVGGFVAYINWPTPEIIVVNTPKSRQIVDEVESFLKKEDGYKKDIIDRSRKAPKNPIEIFSYEYLISIGRIPEFTLDRDYIITKDIDCKRKRLEQIGNEDNPFTGTFNGLENTISNFTLGSTNQDEVSLFNKISKGALVANIRFRKATVNGRSFVSLLAQDNLGTAYNCSIENSSIEGYSSVGGFLVSNKGISLKLNTDKSTTLSGKEIGEGGIVVSNYKGMILDCHSKGLVNGKTNVGGIFSSSIEGIVKDCSSTGLITGYGSIGGIGGNAFHLTLINCDENDNLKFKKGDEEDMGTLLGSATNTVIIGNEWEVIKDLVGGGDLKSISHYPSIKEFYNQLSL